MSGGKQRRNLSCVELGSSSFPVRRVEPVTVVAAFSVTPLMVGESVSAYVAPAIKVVRESGLPNSTDSMFTSLEGEWDEVMAVIKAAVEAVAEAGAPRVSTVIKVDVRPAAGSGRMADKLDSLEEKLSS
jgi:uncharacterized protein (TIGR00106 family)